MSMGMSVAVVAALLGFTAQPAAAYSAGNSTWGSFCAFGHCFPTGTLLHVVDGRGIALSYDRAEATSAGNLCNWWIDFDYYDNAGNRYRHIQGAAHNYCTHDGNVRVDYGMGPYLWLPGRACATLYSSAVYITRQCHYLHS
jgi:hypothetical protein